MVITQGVLQEGRPILSNKKLLPEKLVMNVILSLISICNFEALCCHGEVKLGDIPQLSGVPNCVVVTNTLWQ